MKYATVCSGIEAPSVAWHPIGFKPVFFSEIENFPSKVLAHHYPDVPNLGDMNLIDGTKYAGAIDIICGGTPCQSFSIAGLRKGMADPRGNLALVFLRLVDQIRPKWVVWENVPGVLSSWSDAPDSQEVDGIGPENGRDVEQTNDFDTFLAGLREIGYGCAWRILDAQHFGIPQRRRRVFVVGHLGDWQPAAAVLFERESLRWDFTPGKAKGKGSAANADGCVRTYRYQNLNHGLVEDSVSATLKASCDSTDERSVANFVVDFRNQTVSDKFQTLTANSKGPSANNTPYVMATGQANAEILAGQSRALTCNHEQPIVFAIAENIIGRSPNNGGNGDGVSESREMYTLNASGVHGVATCFHGSQDPSVSGNVTHPIGTNRGLEACIFQQKPSVVRRITPIEAERLQGFPDNYTKIPGAKDGPRYKALGNSMAVPVMRWIGERILKTQQILNSK